MTKEHTPEEIKNRLSNIGEAIGNITLDYIANLEKENHLLGERCNQLLKDKGEFTDKIGKMKCCFNCKHSRTEYEHCKTDKHEKWEIKE
jgi:hypothetical protein